MVAKKIKISPFGGAEAEVDDDDGGNGWNQYTTGGAIAKITFAPSELESDESDNAMLYKHDLAIGAEFMTLSKANLRWVKDGGTETEIMQQEDVPARKLLPTLEHSLQVPRLERPHFIMAALLSGFVNANRFPFDAPEETIMFLGLSAGKSLNTDGTDGWDVTWRFSQRIIWDRVGWEQAGLQRPPVEDDPATPNNESKPNYMVAGAKNSVNGWVSWNHWYDTQKAYWRKVVVGDDVDNIIYPRADFSWLFVPSPV
jgi:hypothetical protein